MTLSVKHFVWELFSQLLEKVFLYIIIPAQNTSYSKRRHDQKYVVLINKTLLIAWYSFELIYIFTESFSDIVWDCYLYAFLGIPYTYFPTCLWLSFSNSFETNTQYTWIIIMYSLDFITVFINFFGTFIIVIQYTTLNKNVERLSITFDEWQPLNVSFVVLYKEVQL